jgi:microcystin-dependent protein
MINPLRTLRALIAVIAILGGHAAFAASATLYNPAPTPLYDTTGALARSAKAYFYSAGTSTPLTVYQDAGLTTPWTFPIAAGLNGVLPPIYLPYVDYRVRITTSADALIYDADNIANPTPASAGGGGGVADNEKFQTGYIISRLTGGTLDGFVRMNGRTIGSASSSATERANADAEDLFNYLCSNLPDSIAAVSGGRGASCAADWAANKTIVVPSMQGRLLAGVDDMGGSAANVMQVSTTASATNGSPTITVASATGLGINMHVLIDGSDAGRISAISGTTVTLDTNFAGTTGSGKAVRASFFEDAQQAGIAAGAQSVSMTTAELPTHSHGVTDPGHSHAYTPPNANTSQAGVAASANIAGTANTNAALTGISINYAGQGLPFHTIQPTRLATFYIHL